jgi:predicted nuclease of predicted toxin-antitoxin system
LKLLLDEMYSPALADALRAVDVDASTVIELGLPGRPDPDVFAAAVARGQAMLTENVADFARISAEHLTAGHRHPGVLIALSSRFSRRPAGIGPLVSAIRAVADQQLEDRVVYLQHRPAEPRG